MTADVHTAARAVVDAWERGGLVARAVEALRDALAGAAKADADSVLADGGQARRSDPATSHRAARLVTGQQRHRVLVAFDQWDACGHDGLTDYELGDGLAILRTAAGTRRGELERAGLVEPTGTTRPTDTGCDANVYRITQRGRDAIDALHGGTPDYRKPRR